MDSFPSMDTYTKRMTIIIIVAALLVSIGGFIYFRSFEAFIFTAGTAVTAAANVLKTFWLKRSVSVATHMDPAFAPNYVRGQGLLRMLFTLAVLVGAGFLSLVETVGFPFLFGAVFGLLTMPVAAYSMSFFVKHDYKPAEGGDANV
jgi:hypothetical protein